MRNATLKQWLAIPDQIVNVVDGLSEAELDRRGGDEGLSIREIAHHLVEANLVAATIVIAGVGRSGSTYDWSWLWPDGRWMKAVGYDRLEIAPAIAALQALTRHIAAILNANGETLKRTVKLFDAPGAKPYSKTVEKVLRDEVAHAKEHLAVAREIRRKKKSTRRMSSRA